MKALKRFWDWLFPLYTHCKLCGCELKPHNRFPFCTRCHWT